MGIDLPGMPSAGSLLNEVRRVQAELAELRISIGLVGPEDEEDEDGENAGGGPGDR